MHLIVILVATLSLTLGGCTDRGSNASAAPPGEPTGRIIVTGSSTMGPLVGEIARRFEARYPAVRVDVQTGGSSRGIADVRRGTADIGMSSRDLEAREQNGLRSHTLAMDGVCFLVHASNPVAALTRDQIRDVYLGRVANWRELGGSDAAITVIDRAAGRSELDLVTRFLDITPSDIVADVIAGENQQGIKLVSSDPNAIVYMSVGTSEYESSHEAPIRLLPLDGVAATTDELAAGRFPLGRPLILVAMSAPGQLVETFLAFAVSDEMDDLVREHSFVAAE